MTCPLSSELHVWLRDELSTGETLGWLTTVGTAYVLIGAAEIGDKSQLVCMALSARHRGLPVMLGAVAAFALLNLGAVVFGAAIAHWIPRQALLLGVAALFAVFGVLALAARGDDDDEDVRELPGHGVFVTTFLMILLAELGDKTQLATAGLSIGAAPAAVWFGATLALASTSGLGVFAGRTVLQRVPLGLLHRLSGILFLILAAATLAKLLQDGDVFDALRRMFASRR